LKFYSAKFGTTLDTIEESVGSTSWTQNQIFVRISF